MQFYLMSRYEFLFFIVNMHFQVNILFDEDVLQY